MIQTLILLNFITFLIIFLIPKNQIIWIKKVSFLLTSLLFLYSLFLVVFYRIHKGIFIDVFTFCVVFPGLDFTIGVDAISLLFILLTSLLIPICLLVNWENIFFRSKDFILLLILLEFLLINVFASLNLVFFYIFFESVLIPMFLIIGIWGSRERKVHAAYQFFIYTFIGSIFMLLSIFIIYLHVGSTNLLVIMESSFTENRQLILWLAFFIAFCVKVPVVPFHIWLPEAHVEAPTSGSILLAGILLKLGTYGFLRFLILLFPYATIYYAPMALTFFLISIIYGSFSTIRQIDLKKVIAYSSIVHMNFALLGLFTHSLEGLQGSLFLMLSHGIISGALFFCVGVLYDRYHTRIIFYYGGLIYYMPLFSIYFFIFILSNMGFPGTSGFIGEYLVLISLCNFNFLVALFSSLSMFFGVIYCIWLYNRVIFGDVRLFNVKLGVYTFYKPWFIKFCDLTKREFWIMNLFMVPNLIFGVYPNLILNITYLSILSTILFI